MKNKSGKLFVLNENVDTDQILPGFAMSYPIEELKKVTLCGSIIPDFAQHVEPGDIIIAGDNFGCGSSREQAPVALKSCEVGAIIAKSFARIFRKNSINIGLPVLTCKHIDEIKSESETGDRFEVDIKEATLTNVTKGKMYQLDKLAQSIYETLEAGGLINKVKVKLKERGEI